MESAHEVLNTSSRKCSNRDNCRRPTAVRKKPWIKWAPKDATSTAHDHPRSGLVAKPLDIGCSFGYYSIYPIKAWIPNSAIKTSKVYPNWKVRISQFIPCLGPRRPLKTCSLNMKLYKKKKKEFCVFKERVKPNNQWPILP